jgi:AcrR family transcriptional regulator
MARRSRDEAEETRENIVSAAIRLFLQDGVSQTTLEKIASEAGYTRGAVYHHFENKAQLLEELVRRAHPPAQEVFDNLSADGTEDPLGDLEKAIGSALTRMIGDPVSRDIHKIFIFNCEFVEKSNPVFEPECRYARAGMEKVTQYLEKAKKIGQLSPDIDTAVTAMTIMALGSGIITVSLRNPWPDMPAVNCAGALRTLFLGLRTEAACKKA